MRPLVIAVTTSVSASLFGCVHAVHGTLKSEVCSTSRLSTLRPRHDTPNVHPALLTVSIISIGGFLDLLSNNNPNPAGEYLHDSVPLYYSNVMMSSITSLNILSLICG